jgi:DNA-binding HxlR family transcriptional regulator
MDQLSKLNFPGLISAEVKDVLDEREWLDVFPALDNVDRFNLLIRLNNEGPLFHNELMERIGLKPGILSHHLNKLMAVSLVNNEYVTPTTTERHYSKYFITEKGREILTILLKK